MANLMGLLLEASAARLRNIARSWQIDADAEPHTLVSRLYDEMTDEFAVKAFLERLNPRERTVLTKIIFVPRGWTALRDLVSNLPFGEDETELILAALEDAGVALIESVRTSGNDILEGPVFLHRSRPSVQTTIARIPPDLHRIFQRVNQQMAAGDQSEKNLHKLLGELDLPHLQMLSERWHLRGGQQSFKKELMLLLEATIRQAREVNRALERLGEGPQLVFRTVRDAQGSISVERAQQACSLEDLQFRTAISSLASLFLVQETYIDGQRYLFIPGGVGRLDDAPLTADGLSEPIELADPAKVLGVAYCFYFDLLALLNYFQLNRVELTQIERKLPRRILAQLREELTAAGSDTRGLARLDYLLHVARQFNLLEARDNFVVATPRIEEWAAMGVVGQAERLFKFWVDDYLWKGLHPGFTANLDITYCQELRERFVQCVRRCEPGKWYSFDSVVRCVAGECSCWHDAVQTPLPFEGSSPLGGNVASAGHNLAEAHLLSVSIAHLFHWASFLSLGVGEGGGISAIQLTPLGSWVLSSEGSRRPEYQEASLTVCPNLEVTVLEPDTLAWHHLLKFALTVSVGRASVHQITKRNVQHAVCWGASDVDFVNFLRKRSRNGIPDNVVSSIEEWARNVRIVNLERLLVLEVDAQTVLEDLLASPKYAKWFGRRLSPTAVVVRDLPDLKKLMREMKSDGYFPRIDHHRENIT